MSKIFTSNVRQLAVASGLALLASSSAFAQQNASATAAANAQVITPISIAKDTDMEFGKIAVGATGGTVVLGTDNSATPSGSISRPAQSAGNPAAAAAAFTVTGEGSYTYSITLPSSPVTLTGSVSGTMTLDTFVSNPSGTGTLSSGTQSLKVGATLTAGNNQASGTYTGTFSVTVAYN
jgi:Domain of unknown function (DUF4402)